METPQSIEATADVVLLNQQPTPGDEAIYTAAEFVTQYKQSFPLRIRVVEGFCGKEERSIISTGDIYNFHSIRNENMMTIEDEGGTRYSIPLSSPVKFGLLYNPDGDITKAMSGFHFRTIGEMTKCKSFPRVMRATKTFHSNKHGSQSSVKADEVLIVKEFERTGNKHKHVEVFSFLSRKDKTLYQECEGGFKTDPGIVQLYLTDIIEFWGDSLPLKAALFLLDDESSENEKIAHLNLEVITLMSVTTESSIVATTIWDRKEDIPSLDDDGIVPVFIPTDLKIKVAILSDKE